MSRILAVVSLLLATQSFAQNNPTPPAPAGKLVFENWMSASFDGVRAGYVHDSVVEIDNKGQKVLRASRRMLWSVKRFGDLATVEAITGTDETPEGTVLGTFMRQQISKKSVTTVRGVVKGNQLHTTAEGDMKFDKMVPWDPKVVGTWGELQMVKQKEPKPGTQFDYFIYEPTVNSIVKIVAKVIAYEEVELEGKIYMLLRINAQPQPIAGITLPSSSFWYDKSYSLIKSETVMPGLGKLVLVRTSQADATKPANGPDLGVLQSITLAQRLSAPLQATAVTYRVKLKDSNPGDVFSVCDRQAVNPVGPDVIELVVKAVAPPGSTGNTTEPNPGTEFLESNFFITSDNPKVKEHATAAVGIETDPWKKSLLIERWVHQNMQAMNFSEAMAPASEVAKSLKGDCTEFSMLTAAMCRAAGVPSRTALGLVYVEAREPRPAMLAMHMWTEVSINGKWVSLDSTLGRGYVGPTHIKITDHSWHRIATMTPLLPLMRLNMASPVFEIVSEQRNNP